MSKKTILVFSTQFMATGGIESHLLEFCHQMSKSGVIIDLVIFNSLMSKYTELQFSSFCRNVYLGKNKRSFEKMLWLIKTGIFLLRNKYNALYTNGQGESIIWVKKIILYHHWVHHHHTSGDALDRATWGTNYLKALRGVPVIIACSQRNAIDIGSFLIRSIETIPCFSRAIPVVPKSVVRNRILQFGYFGRLIPEKGIDILCKLSQDTDFNDICFNIWGEGDVYPKDFFLQFDKLNYHGSFNSIEELIDITNSLDAFLLLSTHPEGLPISLLEVMSAGIPWLATDKGGIPDIACDSLSTRVIPDHSDYIEIKEAILSLANDLKSGKVSNEKQIELYKLKFSANSLVKQWSEILKLDFNND